MKIRRKKDKEIKLKDHKKTDIIVNMGGYASGTELDISLNSGKYREDSYLTKIPINEKISDKTTPFDKVYADGIHESSFESMHREIFIAENCDMPPAVPEALLIMEPENRAVIDPDKACDYLKDDSGKDGYN